jgi:hypothetical protein
MDKYDEALAWLRKQDAGRGTYYEEVAGLIEELLGRVFELEEVEARQSAPRYVPTEVERRVAQHLANRSALYRARQREGSAAIEEAE